MSFFSKVILLFLICNPGFASSQKNLEGFFQVLNETLKDENLSAVSTDEKEWILPIYRGFENQFGKKQVFKPVQTPEVFQTDFWLDVFGGFFSEKSTQYGSLSPWIMAGFLPYAIGTEILEHVILQNPVALCLVLQPFYFVFIDEFMEWARVLKGSEIQDPVSWRRLEVSVIKRFLVLYRIQKRKKEFQNWFEKLGAQSLKDSQWLSDSDLWRGFWRMESQNPIWTERVRLQSLLLMWRMALRYTLQNRLEHKIKWSEHIEFRKRLGLLRGELKTWISQESELNEKYRVLKIKKTWSLNSGLALQWVQNLNDLILEQNKIIHASLSDPLVELDHLEAEVEAIEDQIAELKFHSSALQKTHLPFVMTAFASGFVGLDGPDFVKNKIQSLKNLIQKILKSDPSVKAHSGARLKFKEVIFHELEETVLGLKSTLKFLKERPSARPISTAFVLTSVTGLLFSLYEYVSVDSDLIELERRKRLLENQLMLLEKK